MSARARLCTAAVLALTVAGVTTATAAATAQPGTSRSVTAVEATTGQPTTAQTGGTTPLDENGWW